jgi:protein-tyrosine phosphatase
VTSPGDPAPFQVLTVCTGNICRSPAVERLLAVGLDARYPGGPTDGAGATVVVSSAGVGAVVGAPVSPSMAVLLERAGVDAGGFRARQLTPDMLRTSDLVLALTRRHRSAIVELFPGAVRRTFTLRELARLASHVDPAALPSGPGVTPAVRLRALVPLAAAQRGRAVAVPGDDDVVDPYGAGDAAYALSYGQLAPAVATLVTLARG